MEIQIHYANTKYNAYVPSTNMKTNTQLQGGCFGGKHVFYSAPGGSLQEKVRVGDQNTWCLCLGCGGTRGWQRWPSWRGTWRRRRRPASRRSPPTGLASRNKLGRWKKGNSSRAWNVPFLIFHPHWMQNFPIKIETQIANSPKAFLNKQESFENP